MIIGVLSAEQVKVNIGGSVSFNATNVYAKVSGNISGAETGNKTFSTLTYSASETTGDESDWTNLALHFDSDASPILIEITVENLSTDRELQVSLENDIQANGLNISITKDSQPYTAGQTAMLAKSTGDGTSTTTFVMSLTVANPDENLTDANFKYILNLTDETMIKEITVQSADSSMGSVTGSGTFVIGEQVTLTATPGQNYLFTEWRANSAEGERVSGSSTYTFTLTSTSPTTYYAVFEQAQAGTLTYTYDEEAKTATVNGCTSGANVVVIPETTIHNDETYTVTGIAAGAEYSGPFYSTRSTLKSITIPSTITTIGYYAFNECRALTEINYNATNVADLTSSNYVFQNAGKDGTGITVNIGANVTKLPDYIFCPYNNSSYSANITTVNIAEGSVCESIGSYAFGFCSSLTSITIPENVTSIGNRAFFDCTALTEINYNATAANNLISQNDVFGSAGQEGTGITVNIGANVTKIPNYIFYPSQSVADLLTNITAVNFAEGSVCESIGTYAFGGCSNLTSITIPASVTSIGSSAFNSCYALAEVYNYSSLTITEGSYSNDGDLGRYAKVVYNASELTGEKPETRIKVVGNVQYYSYGEDFIALAPTSRNITEIILDNRTTEINQYAFQYCKSLASITIPDGVTSIGRSAFDGCYGLEYNTDESGVNYLGNDTNEYHALVDDGTLSATSYTIQSTCKVIADRAFYNNTTLENAMFSEGVTSIGINAFYNCSSLTSVDFGANSQLTSIGDYAFSNCSGLTSVDFGANSQLTSIGDYAFSNCSGLTSITIPDSVTSIGTRAFGNCSSLTSVDFGANSQLTSIGDYAFAYCEGLTSITIPDSVISIGNYAFYYCNFSTVTIDSSYAYQNAGASSDTCGYLLQDADTVYVNANLLGSNTASYYLISNFTCSDAPNEDGYYVYTRN